MKQLIRTAFIYAIAGLVGGVFYREFPKWMDYAGPTALAYIHPHLIGLGSLLFLILALFSLSTDLTDKPGFASTIRWYNLSLIGVVSLLFVRGVVQVVVPEVSRSLDFSISGIAGLTHILFTVSLVLLFRLLGSLRPIRSA